MNKRQLENRFVFLAYHVGALIAVIFYPPLTWKVIAFGFVYYFLTSLGLTIGYHRAICHQSLDLIAPLKILFVGLGSAVSLGSAFTWSLQERYRHIASVQGKQKDPLRSFRSIHWEQQGAWSPPETPELHTEDLEKQKLVKNQHTFYLAWNLVFSLLIPTLFCSIFFDDPIGGFAWAGVVRTVCGMHVMLLPYSLGSFLGSRRFNISKYPLDSALISIFTCGEGYQNFHHEFPTDHRLGPGLLSWDPAKFIIKFLSYLGLSSNIQTTSSLEISKAKLRVKQWTIDRKKQKLSFGPEENSLPEISWALLEKRVSEGQKLVVIDGIVHDVGQFISNHPGGEAILKSRIGKDATIPFNGAVYRHSKAARNLAATMRIGRLPPQEIFSKIQTDYLKLKNDKE